jgi:hypothetical protein
VWIQLWSDVKKTLFWKHTIDAHMTDILRRSHVFTINFVFATSNGHRYSSLQISTSELDFCFGTQWSEKGRTQMNGGPTAPLCFISQLWGVKSLSTTYNIPLFPLFLFFFFIKKSTYYQYFIYADQFINNNNNNKHSLYFQIIKRPFFKIYWMINKFCLYYIPSVSFTSKNIFLSLFDDYLNYWMNLKKNKNLVILYIYIYIYIYKVGRGSIGVVSNSTFSWASHFFYPFNDSCFKYKQNNIFKIYWTNFVYIICVVSSTTFLWASYSFSFYHKTNG